MDPKTNISADGWQRADRDTDWKRSNPDIVVYLPKEGNLNDGGNEHFMVFKAPKSEELLAIWTQCTKEAFGDNHAVIARSEDGISWSEPEWIVGTHKGTQETQASWSFPVVSRSGRLYLFYTKSEHGVRGGASGVMGGLVSDDNGHSWAEGPDIVVPSTREDPSDLNSEEIGGFIVWQLPMRDSQGRLIAGYTRWEKGSEIGSCHLMRLENVDEGPDIEQMEITWLPKDPDGVNMPRYVNHRTCEEPSLVLLPDRRLFMTMRTRTGYIWYSASKDNGESWRQPDVLRYRDYGEPVKHPLAPCPIYPLGEGRFLLLFFNNDHYARNIYFGDPLPPDHPDNRNAKVFHYRRPAFISVGEFRPGAHQPVWFSEPKQILDTDGIPVGDKATDGIAVYTTLTTFKGKRTLYYPDRKYYLLGKYITDRLLADMKPPTAGNEI